MRDFFKAFLSFGVATSLQKLLGFVILPIYTRYFTTDEYGIIDMVGTILAVVTIFGLLQLETSLQRYYYEYNGLKKKLLISNVYILIGGCSLLLMILLLLFSSQISMAIFDTDQYAILICLIAPQILLGNLNMLGLVLLRFEKKNFQFLKVILLQVILSLLFVYLFLIYENLGLNGVFYAQIGALLFSTILVTYYVRHLFVFRYSSIISKLNFQYALPQFPARIGSMLLGQANRFFMLTYLSLSAIGIYSVSLKLASSIQLVNTAFVMAWTPFMHAQFKNENNKKIFEKTFPLIVAITFLFVCIITLFSQDIVKLLTTPDYYQSFKYIGGLALFFSLYIVKEVVDIGPKITHNTKYLSYTFFLSVVVNVISLLIFIRLMELEGVVISMIITNLFLVIMSWKISNKLYYIPFSILNFVLLLIPPLILSIATLFLDLTFTTRIALIIFCCIIYLVFIKSTYKKFKQVISNIK